MAIRGSRSLLLAVTMLLGMALLLLITCTARESLPEVRLSEVVPERDATRYKGDNHVLRFAVAPVISPQETLKQYQGLVDYLGQQLGRPAVLVQGKTYAEINDLLRSGDVTLALVCTNAYLEGQEDFGMEALVAPQVSGDTVYYSYLLVPAGSFVNSLEGLRGHTFAFSDPLSNSGRLVVVYNLQQMGERPETFFRRYIFTYSHDNSIKAVAQKLVEGAAVDSLVYDALAAEKPELVTKTRIVTRWGPFGINPLVVHPELDGVLKAQLRDVLLTMHEDPEGQAILARLRVDRFVPPDDQAYASVRRMRRTVRGQE